MSHTILLVDDEAPLRTAYRLALTRHRYAVLEAADGDEALRVLRHHPVDLVVTDLVMPEKEGIETIVEIRRQFGGLPIIAMTGGGRHLPPELLLTSAARLGADRTLQKPFPLSALIDTVVDLLPVAH